MTDLATRIVTFLSQKDEYIEAHTLAEKLGVSSKTIYRTIKKINQDKEIIKSQRGLGYLIDDQNFDEGTAENVNRLTARTYSIAIHVLFSQPKKLRFLDIADKFYISESAMTNELRKMEGILTKFDLQVFRKNGFINVEGTELKIRQALNFLLIRKGDVSKGFDSVAEIFPSIAKKDKEFLISQITLIQEELNVTLVDPYTLNVFSHLYIMMERISSMPKSEEKPIFDVSAVENEDFYETSRIIIENISMHIGQPIDSDEILYLTQYLKSLRYINNDLDDLDDINNVGMKFNKTVLDFAENIVENYQFDKKVNKKRLLMDLCGHLQPMLNRIESNLAVVNPLVKDIKNTYKTEFENLKAIIDKYTLDKYQLRISEDEIAFITLYIVKAIEESYQSSRVLVMCSSGIGTAQLIKTKLLNAIPNLNVTDVISSYSYLKNMKKYNENADLIVSTVAIPNESPIPIVLVSPLLNELDLRRVKAFLDD